MKEHTVGYIPPTITGYQFGEVASALQKSVRRGLGEQAVWWAVELDRSGYGEYAWKRIRIIASEDIGLADTQAAILIRSLYENWKDQRAKKDRKHEPERLFLIHAVLYLAAAPKSRMVDWTLIATYGDRDSGPRREIPDFARDKHTAAGRRMDRGWDHFFDEASRLEPHAEEDGEAAMRDRARKHATQPRDTDEHGVGDADVDPNPAQTSLV